jgi:heavy metal sensor kinase
VAVAGPRGALILVGTVPDMSGLATNRLLIVLGGLLALGILALVAALVSRFVARPVAHMSATAAAISASALTGRIDTSKAAGELRQLAETLNAAFDRLQATLEQQTRFTADASHELRTPLAILVSQIELALRKDRSAAEYRETIETCHRAALRMKSVVESLLTLARADAKELAIARERVDLKPLVEESVALLRPMAADQNVTVGVVAEPCEVAGDRERLRDVVMNLVTNAIRYNRPNGRVDVALKGGVLTVADTGVGIPERDRPHIFERFYRVDKARSREIGGTGLGLAITKWIVEAHGGSIAFTSREGEGTTFTVRFA